MQNKRLYILDILLKYAPQMPLREANNLAKEFEEGMYAVRQKSFIILHLLQAIGVNENGYITNKADIERLKNMPVEFWGALNMALRLQAEYACGVPGLEMGMQALKEFVKDDTDLKPDRINDLKERTLKQLTDDRT